MKILNKQQLKVKRYLDNFRNKNNPKKKQLVKMKWAYDNKRNIAYKIEYKPEQLTII